MEEPSTTTGYSQFSSKGDSWKTFLSISKQNGNAPARPSWEELQEIEKNRLEILEKVELPFFRVLASWKGTCLRALVRDWMIWIPLAIFILIRYRARTGEAVPGIVEYLGDMKVDILGGFLSFLLVLFVNQTNTRFFEMYQLSKKCSRTIQDVAGFGASRLPPAAARRLSRYMNAAHAAGYVGLGGPYSKEHFFDHFNKQYDLLQNSELAKMRGLDTMDEGPAAFKELVTMCQKEVARAQTTGHIDSNESIDLQNRVLDFRAAMDGIYNYCAQPTHFFYIHFLCLLSALYLPLFAVDCGYSNGWGEEASHWTIEVLSGTIVLLQAIFVVGLRLLGVTMIDPYGDDWEDLSVITYVTSTIKSCRIILATQEQDPLDEALEQNLFQKQNDLANKAIV